MNDGGIQKKSLYIKKCFFAVACQNSWITHCTCMKSHAIWVDEIVDVMIPIKISIKAKLFWKKSFF